MPRSSPLRDNLNSAEAMPTCCRNHTPCDPCMWRLSVFLSNRGARHLRYGHRGLKANKIRREQATPQAKQLAIHSDTPIPSTSTSNTHRQEGKTPQINADSPRHIRCHSRSNIKHTHYHKSALSRIQNGCPSAIPATEALND